MVDWISTIILFTVDFLFQFDMKNNNHSSSLKYINVKAKLQKWNRFQLKWIKNI